MERNYDKYMEYLTELLGWKSDGYCTVHTKIELFSSSEFWKSSCKSAVKTVLLSGRKFRAKYRNAHGETRVEINPLLQFQMKIVTSCLIAGL